MTESGKLAGKTKWAGRRRPPTRKAGFGVTAAVQIGIEQLDGYQLNPGQELRYRFELPAVGADQWVGFGGWFCTGPGVASRLEAEFAKVLTDYSYPSWNKVGTLLRGEQPARSVDLIFSTDRTAIVTTYGMLAGGVAHEYLSNARQALLGNMFTFAPEANFYDPTRPGRVRIFDKALIRVHGSDITLKSCNRCGRFLPVNKPQERDQLSFSNHCVAEHRRPCRHSGFGRIPDRTSGENVELEYGFQLECRFCKKFEVNAAHNPQRTSGQMKEDGARRRHFELLLEHLYKGSPQLKFKNETGKDLAPTIYQRFGGRCFKCGVQLASPRVMNLDHTRPLALLWPLDGTATSLCMTHNSEKRARPPSEYYTADEIERLAVLTGIPVQELRNPNPNMEAVKLLGEQLDWFRDEFLTLPALQEVRDGKLTADLVVKALNKALGSCPGGRPYELTN